MAATVPATTAQVVLPYGAIANESIVDRKKAGQRAHVLFTGHTPRIEVQLQTHPVQAQAAARQGAQAQPKP